MNDRKPWLDRWEEVEEIGQGGQGKTYLVASKDGEVNKKSAVLKVLKNQKSTQARGRMYREVAALRTLHSAGGSVPEVFESNVQEFEKPEVRLYFIMEYIVGKTLAEHVAESGGLALENACDIVFKLAESMDVAIHQNIQHRDLKPENIVLRLSEDRGSSNASLYPVIVDYGLSFNHGEEDVITRASETIDNDFLSLPERRGPGGDRHDPRSDLSGLCGILYFCITGSRPRDLLGADGKPPHRRAGHSVRERLDEAEAIDRLEVFLDRGFAMRLDERFQTIEELVSRLQEVLDPPAKAPRENLIDVVARAEAAIIAADRQTQLKEYARKAHSFSGNLEKGVQKAVKKVGNFKLAMEGWRAVDKQLEDYEIVGINGSFSIRHRSSMSKVRIAYQILAKGSECAVFRGLFFQSTQLQKETHIGNWIPVFRYNASCEPNMDWMEIDVETALVESIKMLRYQAERKSGE